MNIDKMAKQENLGCDQFHKFIKWRNIHKMKLKLPYLDDINEKSYLGYTPLLYAIEQPDNDEMLELLFQQDKIDPHATNEEKHNALHLLAFKGQLKWIERFLEKFSDMPIDELTRWGNTPLLEAAQMGHVQVMEYLIQKGANINHKNIKNGTALNYAASNGHVEATRFLIEIGAEIDTRDTRNFTPLMNSCSWGYLEICKILISKGADVNARGLMSQTPLYLATKYNSLELLELLLKNKADPNCFIGANYPTTPISVACGKGNIDIVRMLIKFGCDVNVQGLKWKTPLYTATKANHFEIVKFLLENGADPNYIINCEFPTTSVVSACSNSNIDLLRILIRYGGDVNFPGKFSLPLTTCIKTDFYDGVLELIEAGVNLRGINPSNGNSPLEMACRFKKYDIHDLIRRHL